MLLLAVAMLAASPVPAAPLLPDVTLTRAQARTLSREALNRRLFGEAAADHYFLRPYEEEGEIGPLRELIFLSRPRAGSRAGLCETDELYVPFEGVPGAAGDDPPARATGVQRRTLHLIRDSAALHAGAAPDPLREAQACAAVDPIATRAVYAANSAIFESGLDDFIALVEAARAGRAPARLACSDAAGPMAMPRCLGLLAGLRAGDVSVIYAMCGPSQDAPVCTIINLRGPDSSTPGRQIVFERAVAGGPLLRVQLKPPREIDME